MDVVCLSNQYYRGFGNVSLDDSNIGLLPNRQVQLTFNVVSQDPAALDIVAKEAAAMSGVSYTLKDRSNHTVTVRARVSDPDHISTVHPFVRLFFNNLKTRINGSEKMRARRSGMLII